MRRRRAIVVVIVFIIVAVVMGTTVALGEEEIRQMNVRMGIMSRDVPTVAMSSRGQLSQQHGRQQKHGHDTFEHGSPFSIAISIKFNQVLHYVNLKCLKEAVRREPMDE